MKKMARKVAVIMPPARWYRWLLGAGARAGGRNQGQHPTERRRRHHDGPEPEPGALRVASMRPVPCATTVGELDDQNGVLGGEAQHGESRGRSGSRRRWARPRQVDASTPPMTPSSGRANRMEMGIVQLSCRARQDQEDSQNGERVQQSGLGLAHALLVTGGPVVARPLGQFRDDLLLDACMASPGSAGRLAEGSAPGSRCIAPTGASRRSPPRGQRGNGHLSPRLLRT